MGVQKFVYVGPYINVTSLPKEKKEESKIFLTYLKKEIVYRNKHVKNILDEFGDVDILFQIGESQKFGPNRRDKYHKNSDEDFIFDLNVDFIENALKQFKADYSESLEYLKQNGTEFDIKFGVISYYW